jgi:hypothetical protein
MKTVCHKQLRFESLFNKEVTVCFDGGRMTSDGGGLLLREIDKRYNLTPTAAACPHDPRDPNRTLHDTATLLKQRIFSIALGYEDTNDAHTLRHDAALKVISGKLPETSPGLASQPTLCRFENLVTGKDLRKLADWLIKLYVEVHPNPRAWIILDMDATDDPTHGNQQLSMFHGYFEQHMYHPLVVFVRQHLHGTELASAQMGTLRLKLLKIGDRVRQTTRRIWFHLASSYPCQALFEHVHTTLTIDSS